LKSTPFAKKVLLKQVHETFFNETHRGFYVDLPDYVDPNMSALSSIGKLCHGWKTCTDGCTRLLFGSKVAAVDHLCLCIILFSEDRSGWRKRWGCKHFSSSSFVPISKTTKTESVDNIPHFTLMSIPSRTSGTTVYAVFEKLQGTQQPEFFIFE